MSQQYRCSFSLGPVQKSIELARSVRDLWTGSYLLSWLTAKGAALVLEKGGVIEDPQWEASPLVQYHREPKRKPEGNLLRSGMPNTFRFDYVGDEEKLKGFLELIEEGVQKEWYRICENVHDKLEGNLGNNGWDAGWEAQTNEYWNVQLLSVAMNDSLVSTLRELGYKEENKSKEEQADALLGKLGEAHKLLRSVKPQNELKNDYRPKCSISGEESQLGRLINSGTEFTLDAHKSFWQTDMPIAVSGLGERLRTGERLGAPALIKRLAWSCYFSNELKLEKKALRTTDTATIAAGPWLKQLRSHFPEHRTYLHEQYDDWSGQWLHREKDGEDIKPEVEQLIRQSKIAMADHLSVPLYYAVLMMDGDSIGKALRKLDKEKINQFTKNLNMFSTRSVYEVIEGYLGGKEGLQFNQPIYAGGDDVLAVLPLWMPGGEAATSVLGMANRIVQQFKDVLPENKGTMSAGIEASQGNIYDVIALPENKVTMSAGIAVVHYKESLGEALQFAREAEKEAKTHGKNQACLRVCRRSGEHATAFLPWDKVAEFEGVLNAFVVGASDRWSYKVRRIMDELVDKRVKIESGSKDSSDLEHLAPVIDLEFARICQHAFPGHLNDKFQLFHDTWKAFCGIGEKQKATLEQQRNAITLIQSASFMARGREEA
ncbi:MAG: type III-B CRISPR-associated protein Cas10/Cmr2 [Candidatus Sumerlaeia bacterium]|nr:type III-B CRISPR-associated protein Cas10/Cmr2 [Candidatus Sumerlaeia bacterium]